MTANSSIKVTIAVANYNNEEFIETLILSVLNQTNSNWQLCIADDASTDGSINILEKWSSDSRVSILLSDTNQGAAATFARAINAAMGDVVLLLGGDDALEPNAVASIVNAHSLHPEASMIAYPRILCDASLKPLPNTPPSSNFVAHVELIRQFGVAFAESFSLASYLKSTGIDTRYRAALDQDLRLKLEEVGEVHYNEAAFYRYRLHDHGISQGRNSPRANRYNCLAILEADERRQSLGTADRLTRKERARFIRRYQTSLAIEAIFSALKRPEIWPTRTRRAIEKAVDGSEIDNIRDLEAIIGALKQRKLVTCPPDAKDSDLETGLANVIESAARRFFRASIQDTRTMMDPFLSTKVWTFLGPLRFFTIMTREIAHVATRRR